MPPPLAGLRVLELAGVLAGPAVGQFLAELGAEVVKIENAASGGDVTRSWKLPKEDSAADRSAYFAAVNWGKKSLPLDLTTEKGRQALEALAREADVVITAFRPGSAGRLGADAESLRALNPRLIVGQIVGYSADDPRPGYDAIIQAEAGFTHMNGDPDGSPTKMPVALVDVLAAHQLKEGILVALLRRECTGQGNVVTVSLFDTAVASLANQASNFLSTGNVPQRTGSEHPNIAPYGTVFHAADGRGIVLAVGTDRQFDSLCEVLGLRDIGAAPAFSSNQRRVRNRPFLNSLLQEAIAPWDRDDLLRALGKANIPAGAVNDLADVFATERGQRLTLRDDHSGLGAVRTVTFEMDGVKPIPLTPPPELGGDSG